MVFQAKAIERPSLSPSLQSPCSFIPPPPPKKPFNKPINIRSYDIRLPKKKKKKKTDSQTQKADTAHVRTPARHPLENPKSHPKKSPSVAAIIAKSG